MLLFFRKLMSWVRKHYTPVFFLTLILCLLLEALLICAETGIGAVPSWVSWVAALLMMPLNLLSWPLLLINLQDRKMLWKERRSFPGPSRLQLIYLFPALVTTLAPLEFFGVF